MQRTLMPCMMHADIDRRSPSPSSAGSRAWTVSDFQAAYMSGATTPAHVAENVLKAIAASEAHDPPLKLFAAYDAAHLRQQAKDSAQRCFCAGRKPA